MIEEFIKNLINGLRRKPESKNDDGFPVDLSSGKEREEKLIWYRSEKAHKIYGSMIFSEKIEHMKAYLKLVKKGDFMSLFERGPTYIDEFSKLCVLLAETKGLSFSGYIETLTPTKNPVLKLYIDTFFRNVEKNSIVNDLIGCLGQHEEDVQEMKFIKRAIISLFYKGSEFPYVFHVENPGFFSNTLDFVEGCSTRRPDLPIDKNYDPAEIIIGSENRKPVTYRFNDKPLVLLACETQDRKNAVVNDVVIYSLKNSDLKTKLIIFDHCSSFEKFDSVPNLFWPVIRGSRRIDYMTEELLRLVNARSEGRKMEKADEIIILFDDMTKLNATNLLNKIMEKSVSAHVHFIYPLYEERVPLSEMIRFSEIVDVSKTSGFFTIEETGRVLDGCSHIMPEYDSAYYICEESLTWNENKKTKGTIISDDPLFKSVLRYALEFETISINVLQKRYGIGYKRALELLDALEELGVLGHVDETGKRVVLATLDDDEIDEIDRIRRGLL